MGTINKYDWFKNVYYNKGLHSMEDKTEQIHKISMNSKYYQKKGKGN